MNLGNLIETLAALPAKAEVTFDNGRVPTELISWRGSYNELSLDSVSPGEAHVPTVAKLLVNARKADGKTFQGYKGGDFVMSAYTPVWADPWGEYRSVAITGVAVNDGAVVLQTQDISDYR